MRKHRAVNGAGLKLALFLFAVLPVLAGVPAAWAQAPQIDDIISAVVRMKTFINPDGRSIENLGREREGSAVVIDESGLLLTIGYLMVEAHAAEIVTNSGRTVPATIVGYDHETGFGLLRSMEPLKLKPLPIGKSADVKEDDPVLVASYGGLGMLAPVRVVSRRVFAGSWEYMIDQAIYTSPAHPAWSGAALVNREGKLVGVGSLILNDASGSGKQLKPGNMFVPIDLLMPILGDLLADGRVSSPPKPWLGVNAEEMSDELYVNRVTAQSPAAKAGIKRGDIVIGIGGEVTKTLPEFYRKLWSAGRAGVTIPLDIKQDGEMRRLDIPSMNRLDHLKLRSTF
jgi:S1-C subfamily serine protease